MENPFSSLKDKLDDMRKDVERAVHIAILRESTLARLSRLITLDTDRAAVYQAAIDAIQKEQ